MRILITDENQILKHDNPALEPYADLILVICLNGKAVSDKYECFISPYVLFGLGMDPYGAAGRKFAALESVADQLNDELYYHDDIVFLADNSPASLYPFSILKDRNQYNSLHLCVVSEWRFCSPKRRSAHETMLRDLSSLSSLVYLDSDTIMSEVDQSATLPDLIRITSEKYAALLPNILYGIQRRDWTRAFFDFYSNRYVRLDEGYDMVHVVRTHRNIDPSKIDTRRRRNTLLGKVISYDYPDDDEETLETIEAPVPRPDGKAVCNYLRDLRLQLAAANSIPFESEECPSIGPCAGTCYKCDNELKYLFNEMSRIPPEKRIYPSSILEKWEG